MFISILAAVVVLGILVVVHEFGHFIVAKSFGIAVERFSVGFGKVLFSRTIGETEYAISAFPLGGYVKMTGENPDEEDTVNPRSFTAKPAWVRILVTAAGPILNLCLAVFIFALFFIIGFPVPTATVGTIQAGSAALEAGLKTGDRIIAIDGQAVEDWSDMAARITSSGGKQLRFRVRRGTEEIDLNVTPALVEDKNLFGEKISIGRIGVGSSGDTILRRYSPVRALGLAVRQTGEIIGLTFTAVVKIFQKVVPANTIGGPIMIFQEAGKQAQKGFADLVSLIAFLSIQLGIFNLLPIPILDGGNIAFLAVEAVRGKPLSVKKREMIQQVGLVLIISLFLFASYNDIMRLDLKGLIARWLH